jgi:hypothetical protein
MIANLRRLRAKVQTGSNFVVPKKSNLGAWFRYIAGLVEMGGALLMLILCLEMVEFALLSLTMGVATVARSTGALNVRLR